MIYIEHDSKDARFWFALESYFLQERDLGQPVFLFWHTRPTVMIGSYQVAAAEINEAYVRNNGICVVRRLSGGGAIYTDPGSWQFSYILRNQQENPIDFKPYVQPIQTALSKLGVHTVMSGRNDLLVAEKKCCGNAQYRNHGALLHHGSILFDANIENMVNSLTVADDKIIAKGIKSIRQRVTNIAEHLNGDLDTLAFKKRMLCALVKGTDIRYTLTAHDLKRIYEISREKFESWDWTYGQSPSFQIIKSRRLSGGKVDIHLNLERGCIQACSIHGDFFYSGDITLLTQSLQGCHYREDAVRDALAGVLQHHSFFHVSLEELVQCFL